VSQDFHEAYRGGEAVAPPSDRSTGLVFAFVTVLLAYPARESTTLLAICLGSATVLGLVSWLMPSVLRPLTLAWFRFGLALHRIVNPVVMVAMFVTAIVPMGLLMRLWRDPLQRRRRPDLASYWVAPEATAPPSMRNQF
jgi:hypothetical protein